MDAFENLVLIDELNAKIDTLENTIESNSETIEKLEKEIERLTKEYSEEIDELNDTIEEKTDIIDELNEQIDSITEELEELKDEWIDKDLYVIIDPKTKEIIDIFRNEPIISEIRNSLEKSDSNLKPEEVVKFLITLNDN